MHKSVMDWARVVVTEFGLQDKNTLEVGSYNVNGSVRELFSGKYVGVDIREGPGVDAVVKAGVLPFADAEFDVVVSTEMLEHDSRPWLSVKEMARVCRPGGFVLITTRGFGFGKHDYPEDYWRFSMSSMEVLVKDAGLAIIGLTEDPQEGHPGVFAACQK